MTGPLPPIHTLRRNAPDRSTPRLPTEPPHIRLLVVDPPVCVEGDDILVRWEVTEADSVSIDDLGAVPSTGSARILAEGSRPFVLRAANGCGGCSRQTDVITVLPLPAIASIPIVLPETQPSLTLTPRRSTIAAAPRMWAMAPVRIDGLPGGRGPHLPRAPSATEGRMRQSRDGCELPVRP